MTEPNEASKPQERPPIMDEKVRQRLLSDAQLEDGTAAYLDLSGEPIVLRTFSLMTMELCEKMGLTMMMDGPDGLDNAAIIAQVTAFAWAQSAPIPEVMKHLKEGTWEDQVELFKFRLDIPVISKLLDDVGRLAKQAAASAFELKKKATNPTT